MSNHLLIPNLRSSPTCLSQSQSLSPSHQILLSPNELLSQADYSPMVVESIPKDQKITESTQFPKPRAEKTDTAQTGKRVKILQFHGFERFRILQRKLKFESEQSSCRSSNQSQNDNLEEFQSQLVHTQILESGVFHQRIMMAAAQRSLPSHFEEALSLRNQPKNKREDFQSNKSSQDEEIDINMFAGGQWTRETLKIKDGNIRFSNFVVNMDCISKIKIMVDEKEKSQMLIKITVDRSDYLISVQSTPCKGRKQSLRIFLKIVVFKFLSQTSISKTTIQSFTQKIKTGKLFKKSQYLSKWEERLITITDGKLISRKDQKSAPSFAINKGRTSQLWTRFERHLDFPIIKVQYDRKTEFGLPKEDFEGWMLMFLSLLESA